LIELAKFRLILVSQIAVASSGDVTVATEPGEIIAAVRVALRFDEARARQAEVRARGAGTVSGLPAEVTWQCHVDGRARLRIAGALGEATTLDGTRRMRVGPAEPSDHSISRIYLGSARQCPAMSLLP